MGQVTLAFEFFKSAMFASAEMVKCQCTYTIQKGVPTAANW